MDGLLIPLTCVVVRLLRLFDEHCGLTDFLQPWRGCGAVHRGLLPGIRCLTHHFVALFPFTFLLLSSSSSPAPLRLQQISPWVVTPDALEPFACEPPAQSPPPLAYMAHPAAGTAVAAAAAAAAEDDDNLGAASASYDIVVTADIIPAGCSTPYRFATSNYRHMYWSFPQMVAHHTLGGCNLGPGDLLGSGTMSGPGDEQLACLLEARCAVPLWKRDSCRFKRPSSCVCVCVVP